MLITCVPPDTPQHQLSTPSFEVRLRDRSVEMVTGADAYQQEQSMTTFFRTSGQRGLDCWATRIASFRTEEILAIRRLEP